jgi:hypothetical protein
MNRRGLFAAFALAPIMAVEAFAKPKPEGEPHDTQSYLILLANKPRTPKITNSSSMYLIEETTTDPDKAVSMAVGEDGNLWLKSKGGEWKRVVTE